MRRERKVKENSLGGRKNLRKSAEEKKNYRRLELS